VDDGHGTPFIYQGQEIGMTNFPFTSMNEIRDVESKNVDQFLHRYHVPRWYRWKTIKHSSRDNVRTPMQWNAKEHAGFTNATPWITVNPNYRDINVHKQQHDKHSIWHFYKQIIALRTSSKTLIYGDFKSIRVTNSVFVYQRNDENTTYVIALNLSRHKHRIKQRGDILISNYGTSQFTGLLQPYEAIILKGN